MISKDDAISTSTSKYSATKQESGLLYVTADGESWGHGIEVDSDTWNALNPQEKDLMYNQRGANKCANVK